MHSLARVGLVVTACFLSGATAEAADNKCNAKTYSGPWLVLAGNAICTVEVDKQGRIESTKQCYYGRTDRPIKIKGDLKIRAGSPCAVDGDIKIKGGKDVLFDRYRIIAAGIDGALITGFLKNGKVVEGFTLTRMTQEEAR